MRARKGGLESGQQLEAWERCPVTFRVKGKKRSFNTESVCAYQKICEDTSRLCMPLTFAPKVVCSVRHARLLPQRVRQGRVHTDAHVL